MARKLAAALEALRERVSLDKDREAVHRAEVNEAKAEAEALRQELMGAKKLVETAREREKEALREARGGGESRQALAEAKQHIAQLADSLAAEQARAEALAERVTALKVEAAQAKDRFAEELEATQALRTAAEARAASLEDDLAVRAARLAEQQAALDAERLAMVEGMAALHRESDERNLRAAELTRQLAAADKDLEAARKELRDYKMRAVQALQSRQNEAAEGGAGSAGAGGIASGGAAGGFTDMAGASPALGAQFGSAKRAELEALLAAAEAERDRALAECEALRERVTDAELTLSLRVEEAAETGRALARSEQALSAQQQQAATLTARASRLEEELRAARDAASSAAEAHRATLADLRVQHGAEVTSLQRRLAQTASEEELTQRLSSMTDHLEAKQAAIAALTSERTALQSELKKVRDQLASKLAEKAVARRKGGHDDEFVVLDVEAGQQSAPIRRATTAMDAVSLTLATNLKRSPMFRYRSQRL